MPGHIKKSEGPDPDPDQWLIVSDELKVKLKSKPYDAKKSCWVPEKSTGGYDEGLIQSTDGDKVTVKILGSDDTKVFKKDQVGQVNPPKFDCSDDMSGLTYLNDACVLWNSVVRYKNELIYTYSGLFCIAINPYKRFPIYTQRAMDIYIGKRRSECPPHIFGVAEGSYQGMLNAGKNQSILITGESGAGKTENTKKVISYFASIGASGKKKEGEVGLEDKIVQTNPVLEAWGNAKTVRNDNSSRFGKFIRIWFNQGGKLSGADMVVYLLEKSRLTFQAELERCYHAFYNIMSDAVPELKENCLLSNDIYDYWWVSQGKVTVPSIDDKEDMQFADEAYDILGFSQEEKFDVYKLTSVVMHMGNMTKDFVPVGKEEQAEIKDDTNSIKVATLCGIDSEWMNTYFCKPKLKVGMEWVSKGQTCSGAASSVAGIGRKIYELTFRFIVEKCNETLFDPTMKKVQYIGCLDIAGFEIFDYNGLWVFYPSSRKSPFFLKRQIKHLLPNCMKTCWEKCENFQKPNPRPDPNAHFAVIHYAATVSYNLTAWLEKNKDPLNDTIVELFKNGSNKLLTQLDDLMKTLYATDPAFIRCVVPNTHKQPGGVEPGLVMHQYQCNGVLAGIAICRKGFPNKMVYPEFKNRYNILAAQAVAKAKNDKNAAAAVLKSIKLDAEKFRLGHTKVFFRAGILGYMEEIREDKIGAVLSWLQAQARGKTSRLVFKKMQDQKLALYCCQRTIRNWHIGKTWLWWQVWLFLKPNLKCTKFSQYKAEYEEKIAIAEANIDKALAERKKVEVVNSSLLNQKNELVLALQSGGSAVQDIIDKTVRIEAMAADVQKQLDDCNNRIKGEKTQKESIEQAQSKVSIEMNSLGDEIKNLEDKLGNAEQDRSDKDDQIRTLREEIEHQNDMIQKLHREKKELKGKLEQALDEAEDSLEREKKCKGDIEKLKRKVEGDLKLTQETVSDLERVQAELNQSVQRKDKELSALSAKIEDESTLGSKYGKQIKELQSRMEELDEELIIERQNRSKAEKNRSILKKDIEDLGSRLEEAGASTATQVELNKKREAELGRLKSELEEMTIAQEGTLAALRMKHNNTMAELGEQIDGLNNNKMKSEKDKANMERDLQEARSNLEEGVRGKAEIDKNGKLIQGSIVDANQKLDELARALNEGDSQKKRLQVEKADLERQIDEGENAMASLNKQKISLTTQFEDNKRIADGEAHCLKALSKAQAETQLWRSRYETEGMGRVEELEGSRGKLQARIQEAEETVESLQSKISNGEKSKNRMQADLDDISMEYERTHAAAIITEKRGKNFDKVINEWKCKGDDISNELDASEKECRNYNSELFRLRAAQNDVVEQLDIVKRENKNLADEIKDLLDQLGDGGRSIHELDKQRRRLEVEKEEFQAALEEAEAALEQEENKVLRAQLELGQAKQEIDHKIQEKEDIFNNTRKNHQRAMDSLSASLEAEQKAKSEALRIKKKLESDINELEIALDHANKANSEGQKAIKRYQSNLRDTIQAYEDQCHHRQEIMENVGICDRKANALSGELEESRALLNSSERSKRQLDTELVDSRNTTNEMQVINSKAMHEKRNVESIIHTLQAEIDEVLSQAKNSEEKSKRAMIDAARLADELRAEQEHTTNGDRCNRALGSQLSELENRLIDAENASMKSGKEILSKLEMKIRELEIELGSVQSRTQENYKAYQRSERKIKELQFQQEEDRNNQDKMSDLASKLQQKIKTYKQQIEEAEEIAALNLAKYRKAQQELEETEERCKMANTSMSTV
ncbi:MYH6_7 [Lepeophtheirus salmonis]|uniref:MYH6_7 n=1 Tax=Lepeophtheirus salmonis TaxID=72036 RepID=A0A7R8CX21_LEPSM|nr:MYH6_7 [Lepeophtheirus salmonis]CAF2956857.1 MYH6_7 [Lepeophtheirus salmonis]